MRQVELRFQEVARLLEARPRDHEVWQELARLAVRAGALPGWLSWKQYGGPLRSAMRAQPEEPALRGLALQLLGLEACPVRSPGRFWRRRRAPGDDHGVAFDPLEGMPLAARHPGLELELRWVPPGSFPDHGGARSGEPHPRKLGGGYLGRFPVTVGQWTRWLQGPGYGRPVRWSEQRSAGEDLPVSGISWEQARSFCQDAGGALPPEDDWEWAGRGEEQGIWPWGDRQSGPRRVPVAWWRELLRVAAVGFEGERRPPLPPPVGQCPRGASPFGLEEMTGHQVEWVATPEQARGGVRLLFPGQGHTGRDWEEPWTVPGERVARPSRLFDRRWLQGPVYPGLAGVRLWVPTG